MARDYMSERRAFRRWSPLVVAALAASAQAQTHWPQNGHSYEVVVANVGWTAARDAAAAHGGYLATLTSPDETSFVLALVLAVPGATKRTAFGESGGPWLGGYQLPGSAEPAGGWTWLTGEAFTPTNWAPGEPNNNEGNEHYLHLYTFGPQLTGTWNDLRESNFGYCGAYVIEWDCAGCVPDMNCDGSLNVFDFLAFQSAFGDGNLSADFDGSGTLNVFDFLAFQTAFGEGC